MYRTRAVVLIALAAVLAASCGAAELKRVFAYYQVPALDRSADEALAAYKSVITDLSPTIIEVMNGAGTVVVTPETKYLDILAGDKGTMISPLIRNYNFDKKIARWSLLWQSAQDNMVQGTLKLLESEPRYKGVVIDIENTSPDDRRNYSAFIRRMYEALHPKGYKVFTVVGPKEQDIPKAMWTRAFDYKEIGKYSDFVILMTYNQHWKGGPPGPCAAIDWFEACVKYACDCMPAEKVIAGIPFYGYDWPETGAATSLTHKKASALIDRIRPEKIEWSEEWATPFFTYVENGSKHEVWFEDVRSVAAKLEVCRKLGVGGVAAWRLGDEDPRFWEVIGRYSRGESIDVR